MNARMGSKLKSIGKQESKHNLDIGGQSFERFRDIASTSHRYLKTKLPCFRYDCPKVS